MMTLPAIPKNPLVEIEFIELPMLGPDVAPRAGDRAHHHGFGLDHVLAEFDAGQERAGGDAGGGEKAVALGHVLDAVDHLRVLDAHHLRALALLAGVEDQAALHLAADAAQRSRREYA